MNEPPFNASDLPLVDGKVYHLGLRPEEIAKDIIIVGDPERVPFIAEEFFISRELDVSNRGLRTITGIVRETGQRVSITTSGMGTPSLEIVLNEIVALHEIDFRTVRRKERFDRMTIIRVGTSGGIQPDTDIGTLIITDYVAGLDNTGHFYNAPHYDLKSSVLEERIRRAIDSAIQKGSRFKGMIFPYAARADQEVVKALEQESQRLGIAYKKGITVSNAGFFANQGRSVSRIPLTVPDIDNVLSSVDTGIEGLRIENLEMEASFLLHFMTALGHRAGVICPVIDKRKEEKFATRYARHVQDAAQIALRALNVVR
ncbi:MAG: nucleoside phosphorylase [Nitrospirota bacterium]